MATVLVVIEGEGVVRAGDESCASECTLRVPGGTLLGVEPSTGWRFDHWGGGCEGSGECAVQASGAVQAVFAQENVLDVQIEGKGTVSASDGRTCGDPACRWVVTDAVLLTAQAAPGFTFVGFEGQCAAAKPCLVASGRVKATFLESASLEVVFVGDGTGVVRDTSGVVACTQSCTISVLSGSKWELEATPDLGTLPGVFEAPCGSTHCAATAPQRVVVHFERGRRVSVTLLGQGRGAVSLNGADFCPGSCATLVATDAGVHIAARTSENSRFAGFAGKCSGTADCDVPPGSDAVDLTAQFESALVWARSYPVRGGVAGSIWTALQADDAGITAALSVGQGLEVDGVVYKTPPASNGSAMTLFLDWDGGTSAVVPVVDGSNAGGFNALTAFARANDRLLVGFGTCRGGDVLGTPCPSAGNSPLVLSFSDAGVDAVLVRSDLADGYFEEAALAGSTLFGRFRRQSLSGFRQGFVTYPGDLDGGATYEGPFSGTYSTPLCSASRSVTCALPIPAAPFAWQGCTSPSSGSGSGDLALLSLDELGQCSLLHRFTSVSPGGYFGPSSIAHGAGGLVLAGVSQGMVDFGVATTGTGTNHWLAWVDEEGAQKLVTAPHSGGAIRSLAAGASGTFACGFITAGSTFFGRLNLQSSAFVANFDGTGALTRFWAFPNAVDGLQRMAYVDGRIVLLMVGSNVSFDGKPLAGDSQQRLHVLMLEE